MKSLAVYLIVFFIPFIFISCRKEGNALINNSAFHFYGTASEEEFLSCGVDDNGNLDVFVSKEDTIGFKSLELWKISQSGEVKQKHIIDSSTNYYSFRKPWTYGEGAMAKLPDGGWAFAYTKVIPAGFQEYRFCKTTKNGELQWTRDHTELLLSPNYFFGTNIYWRNNSIEFFGTENRPQDIGGYLKSYKYDLNGNYLDSFSLQQDTVLPDSPLPISQRNILNVANYIIPIRDGFATTIQVGQDPSKGYNSKILALCLFEKNGKVKRYRRIGIDNPWAIQANTPPFLLPTSDGGILMAGCQLPKGQLFVSKFSSNGDSLWTRFIGNTVAQILGIINHSGGSLIYGSVPSNNLGLIGCGYVAMLNDNGNVLWEYRIGGINSSCIKDVKELPNGDIACVGFTTSFNKGKNQKDGFLVILHSNGKPKSN